MFTYIRSIHSPKTWWITLSNKSRSLKIGLIVWVHYMVEREGWWLLVRICSTNLCDYGEINCSLCIFRYLRSKENNQCRFTLHIITFSYLLITKTVMLAWLEVKTFVYILVEKGVSEQECATNEFWDWFDTKNDEAVLVSIWISINMEISWIERRLKSTVWLIFLSINLVQAFYWPVNTVMQVSCLWNTKFKNHI